MVEEERQLDLARSLSALFVDLREELTRRARQLDHWLQEQWKAQEEA
jgi:hypothetical protein